MIIESHFKPVWWLRNKHVQTVWQKIHRHKLDCPTIAERITLPDGDFLDLAWTEKPTDQDTRPIVFVLHGLEGSIDSTYAKGMMNAIRARGWIGVLMHFRGCSKEPNLHARAYHSGETEDVLFAATYVANQYPNQDIASVGFSLGGNALVKLLGEKPTDHPFKASVSICPPLDLEASSRRIQRGLSRVYQKYLLDMLHESIARKMMRIDLCNLLNLDRNKLKKIKSLWQFDELITAPLHGFDSAQDYYQKSSGKHFLRDIQTPTLVIHAKDDPFLSNRSIPKPSELSHRVTFEISEFGGHVGFVNTNQQQKIEYWLEHRSLQFIENHLKGL
ncbi:hydrolase [Catenovulum sp. SM1970]|uniref:hydrolase n=1 Tax=Marinifaba aquimaris TaxID=2741323 RepID=UPI0015738A77|nr:hydrolase [Marinifaba aquimaris]NTS75692.1 hydrolase [Marinifaba aquimaris]